MIKPKLYKMQVNAIYEIQNPLLFLKKKGEGREMGRFWVTVEMTAGAILPVTCVIP